MIHVTSCMYLTFAPTICQTEQNLVTIRMVAPRSHLLFQLLAVLYDPHDFQHNRDTVISKHGESRNVRELPQTFSTKGAIQVTHKDLCTLIEEHLRSMHSTGAFHVRLCCTWHGMATVANGRLGCAVTDLQHASMYNFNGNVQQAYQLVLVHDLVKNDFCCGRTPCSHSTLSLHLPALVDCMIPESWEMLSNKLHQAYSRLVCCLDQVCCLPIKMLQQRTCNLQTLNAYHHRWLLQLLLLLMHKVTHCAQVPPSTTSRTSRISRARSSCCGSSLFHCSRCCTPAPVAGFSEESQ